MYNSYLNNNQYGQFYPNYMQGAYNNYQTMQPQANQTPMQPQTMQVQEVPFTDVRYGTLDEAKAHIVAPTKSVMFINRNLGEFYVKSANQMGEPLLESFKYSKIDNNAIESKPEPIDTAQFVRTEALNDYIKKDSLGNFLTRDDLKGLTLEIDKLKKQLEINRIEKGDFKNGK